MFPPSLRALLEKYRISSEILKFIISGGTAEITELVFLYAFTEFFGLWYIFSAVLAFLIASCVSFSLQKFWTFKDQTVGRVHIQIPAYLLTALINLGVNVSALYVLVEVFGVWYILAQILVGIGMAISSFLIYKFLIFKKHESEAIA